MNKMKINFSGVNTEENNKCINFLKNGTPKNSDLNFSDAISINKLHIQKGNIKNILFYCSPEYMLSKNVSLKKELVELSEVDSQLRDWKTETELTLSFYLSHIDNSILVDVEQSLIDFKQFLQKINIKFGLHLIAKNIKNNDVDIENDKINLNIAYSEVAKSFELMNLSENYEIQDVYEEIVSAADLFVDNVNISFEYRARYLSEHCKSRLQDIFSQSSLLADENSRLNRKLANADDQRNSELLQLEQLQKKSLALSSLNSEKEAEIELSLLQIIQLQEELEGCFNEKKNLGSQNSKLSEELAETECESEIALLQIQQLQEELEFYYLKLQASISWMPTKIEIDFLGQRLQNSLKLAKLV